MQFKIAALLTLVVTSVNSAVLNKRSSKSCAYFLTGLYGFNARPQIPAYAPVGPILLSTPSLRSIRDELVASSDGKRPALTMRSPGGLSLLSQQPIHSSVQCL